MVKVRYINLNENQEIQKWLPLSDPAYLILGALIGHEKHGYAIIKHVEKHGNSFKLLTGTLYRNIDKMLKNSLIEKVDPPADADSDDVRRVYYTATSLGKRVFDEQTKHYNQLLGYEKQLKKERQRQHGSMPPLGGLVGG